MAFAIVEIDGKTAKELAGWDWAALLDEDFERVKVDVFETAAELKSAAASAR